MEDLSYIIKEVMALCGCGRFTSQMKPIFDYIDHNERKFIRELREIVAIRSVSAWPHARNEIIKMTDWVGQRLVKLGAHVEYCDIEQQVLPDGTLLKCPPIILGTLGNNPNKKTVCVYGHLDVQPAYIEDGWNTNPFILTEIDGKLYGRGATDNKGPVLGWLHAIEAYHGCQEDLPVNLRLCFEGMEESASEGLHDVLVSKKDSFLKDVDYVCISDNYWLGKETPCITYGLRGICYFFVEIEGFRRDLHSGCYGGIVYEPMWDLMWMLNTLVDKDGTILIDGMMDSVREMTAKEEELYKSIDFDPRQFRRGLGASRLLHKGDKDQILMHRWRYPSISVHGIQGPFSEEHSKDIIPSKIIGKFSVRIVPDQTVEEVQRCVLKHLDTKWKERGSINKYKSWMFTGSAAWVNDPFDPHYKAGRRATRMVYEVEPNMTREGGTIPVTVSFQQVTNKNVMMLPMGRADDGAHGNNEKVNITNFIGGTKVMAAYLNEIAKL